jgi:ribose 5-phosphate isomerase B
MKIIIGSDQNGFVLKEDIKIFLEEKGYEVVDIGCFNPNVEVDYPDVGEELAARIAKGEFERGILICGTGIGMAIVANKIPGVRAACCHDPYSAERARKSNNAQIMTMGSQIVAPILAHTLLDHWLGSEFAQGRSTPKIAKINSIDEKYRR